MTLLAPHIRATLARLGDSRWRPIGSSPRVFPLIPPSPCPGCPLPGALSTHTSSTSLPPPGCTRRRSMEAWKARSTSWSPRAAAVRSSTTTTTAGWISSCSPALASKALRPAPPTASTRTIVTGRSRTSRRRPAWVPWVGLPASASGTTTTTASTISSAPSFGQNVLYRNNGDGTFTDVTKAAGLLERGAAMGSRMQLPGLQPGRTPRPVRLQLRAILVRTRARSRGEHQLPLEGHSRRMRTARDADRTAFPLSEQWGWNVHRRQPSRPASPRRRKATA